MTPPDERVVRMSEDDWKRIKEFVHMWEDDYADTRHGGYPTVEDDRATIRRFERALAGNQEDK